MIELTIRQRIAAVVLLVFLGIGGILIFISRNSRYVDTLAQPAAQDKIYVHICGAVEKPGIIALPPATRKFEALKLAGGSLPEADLNGVNLAEFALDGEQIYVPKIGEDYRRSKSRKTVRHEKSLSKPPVVPVKVQWPLDLNAATAEQLEKVPGIGPGLSAKIVQYRNKSGRFQNYADLQKVGGIGRAKMEKFRPYLTVQ